MISNGWRRACCSGSTASSLTRGELEVGLFETHLDDVIERALDPGLQRHEAFLRGLDAQALGGRAIDLGDERRGRYREGVADDARQPFVVLIFQRRLARLGELELARAKNLTMRRRARLPLISASK